MESKVFFHFTPDLEGLIHKINSSISGDTIIVNHSAMIPIAEEYMTNRKRQDIILMDYLSYTLEIMETIDAPKEANEARLCVLDNWSGQQIPLFDVVNYKGIIK